jgi:hypothetical protein
VMVLRHDQIRVQEALHGWEWAGDPPGILRPWRPGEHLRAGSTMSGAVPGPVSPGTSR